MIRLRLTLDAADARRQLARVERLSPAAGLDAANALLLRVARVYPPPPPGSRYRRTHTLRDGWEPVGPFAAGRQGVGGVVNEGPYADYVQGERQAAIHQGRWRTAAQIAADQEAAVVAAVEAAVDRQIGGSP